MQVMVAVDDPSSVGEGGVNDCLLHLLIFYKSDVKFMPAGAKYFVWIFIMLHVMFLTGAIYYEAKAAQ